MDYQVIWTPRSLNTLQELVAYVAERNPDAARQLGGRILNRVELIRKHPFIAEVFHPLERVDIRDYPVPPTRLIYRVHQEQRIIYVLTVWHGARDEPEFDSSETG
jgi:toxin ParE1/3/4